MGGGASTKTPFTSLGSLAMFLEMVALVLLAVMEVVLLKVLLLVVLLLLEPLSW